MIRNACIFFLFAWTVFCYPKKAIKSWTCSGINLSYNNLTYCLYKDNIMSFDDAEKLCNGNGADIDTQGHLLAIHSVFVNKFIVDTLKKYQIPNIWLGAVSDIEWAGFGGFDYWNDGTSFDYSNFASGGCCKGTYILSMNSTDGLWYPLPDNLTALQIPFICQQPKYLVPQTALGIDAAGVSITKDQFGCLKSHGLKLFMASVYDPSGFVDETGISNLINAIQGGNLEFYLAYITPCVANCKNNLTSGADQVKAVLSRLEQFSNIWAFQVWINVDKIQPWSSDKTKNQQFILDAINAVFNKYNFAGVITNYNSWSSVVGATFTEASEYGSLWWANWNGIPDLETGWTSFGGWHQPEYHQYAGGVAYNTCMTETKINYSYFDDSTFFALKDTKKSSKNGKRI